jgi:hypothetical protein
VVIVNFSKAFIDFLLYMMIFFVFSGSSSGTLVLRRPRLRPCQTTPWGSYNYSPSPSSCYSDRDARRFKAERDETRRELGDVSKAGITQLELEH